VADNTFNGIQFHQEQQDGTSVLVWPVEHVTAVEHIPGSDTDVVQHLGRRGVQTVTFPLVVKQANWAALRALAGQTLTLALIGESNRQATLKKLEARWFEREALYKGQITFEG
jgi:hypothetical protein